VFCGLDCGGDSGSLEGFRRHGSAGLETRQSVAARGAPKRRCMKLTRWRQLESLYNKALQMDESRRGEFVCEKAAGDGELRHAAERLLPARPAAASLLEQPALQEIAHEFAATAGLSHQYWIGRQVGNYQFVSLAGAGGMGEVYRARDTKLKREVAIKVIPDEF